MEASAVQLVAAATSPAGPDRAAGAKGTLRCVLETRTAPRARL